MDNNEPQLTRLEDKLDKVSEDVTQIKVSSAIQNTLLDEHQRRSLAQEESVALLRSELKPVFKQTYIISWAAKVAGLLISGGLITLIFQHYFH